MPRYYGPYRHGEKWRILIRVPGQKQQVHGTYETEDETKRELRRLRIAARKLNGPTVSQALDRYATQLQTNGLREHSIDTTLYRLRKLFNPVASLPWLPSHPSQAKELFAKLMDWSVDTRRNALAEAKTFCRRAKLNGWTEGRPVGRGHG